ncbi:MAG TPA: hypothetical protein ENH26_00445 [Candidatus Wolfebacteria bacterium]|nr:hypothetical protein [Candidatus Wolfebacteria bacterium]
MRNKEIKNKLLLEINKLKTPEGYLMAGYPNYSTLFGRDSLISSWQMIEIDSEIAKNTLRILSKYQGKIINSKSEEEPGKILHEYRFKREEQLGLPHWKFPYFGSVDSTPLFIIVAGEYFKKTNDKDFLLEIWDNIAAALNWLLVYGDSDKDNFIEYEMKNSYGLFHQGWRDAFEDHLKIIPPVAIIEAQSYAYAAYNTGIELSEHFSKDSSLKNLWTEKAETLQKAFQKAFWWEEESYYYLALDGSKNPRKSVSSNSGHLLLSDIISEEFKEKLVKRLFMDDLFTPYGIRTVSEKDPDFDYSSYHLGSVWPHDNWLIYYGLRKSGFLKEAKQIKQALLSAYQELNYIPELFAVKDDKIIFLSEGVRHPRKRPVNIIKPNKLQAWSVCGLLNMIWED